MYMNAENWEKTWLSICVLKKLFISLSLWFANKMIEDEGATSVAYLSLLPSSMSFNVSCTECTIFSSKSQTCREKWRQKETDKQTLTKNKIVNVQDPGE